MSNQLKQLSALRAIVSNMKKPTLQLPEKMTSLGRSSMFNYVPDEPTKELKYWEKLAKYDLDHSYIGIPQNGFEEMIALTEQGKLWQYPIDNEQGLDKEKQVPFEDHVFLDQHLQDFPDNEYVKTFMEFVVSGLAKNHWMSVERKRDIIRFYKNYFEEKLAADKDSVH